MPTVTPSDLIVLGLGGAIAVNIIMFIVNAIRAMGRIRGKDDPAEIEAIIAPALGGAPTEIGPGNLRLAKGVLWLSLSIAAVGAVWALTEWGRNA